MQLAQTSGYFFKCPLCNNSDVFREALVMKGVFIPDRDASWESEPDAFAEVKFYSLAHLRAHSDDENID